MTLWKLSAPLVLKIPTPTAQITAGLQQSLLISERRLKCATPVNLESWINKNKMVRPQIVDLWSMPSLHQYRQPAFQHVSLCGFIMSKSIKTWFWFDYNVYLYNKKQYNWIKIVKTSKFLTALKCHKHKDCIYEADSLQGVYDCLLWASHC